MILRKDFQNKLRRIGNWILQNYIKREGIKKESKNFFSLFDSLALDKHLFEIHKTR